MPIHDSDKDGKPDTNPAEPPELHRVVTCTAGSVEMRCEYEPRHDYGRAVPEFRQVRRNGNGIAVETRGGRQTMMLLSSVSLSVGAVGVKGEFTPGAGRVGNLRTGVRQQEIDNTRAVPHTGKTSTDPKILAGPRRGDALQRPMARAGGAIIPGVAPDDVPWHRGHCCRSDDEPAGDPRRVPELGLPLLMAA